MKVNIFVKGDREPHSCSNVTELIAAVKMLSDEQGQAVLLVGKGEFVFLSRQELQEFFLPVSVDRQVLIFIEEHEDCDYRDIERGLPRLTKSQIHAAVSHGKATGVIFGDGRNGLHGVSR